MAPNQQRAQIAGPRAGDQKGDGEPRSQEDMRREKLRVFQKNLNNDAFRRSMAAQQPAHLRTAGYIDSLVESIMSAVRANTKLLDCDAVSLLRAAEWVAKRGLTVGDNVAWLVPYNTKVDGQYVWVVQPQLGYVGAMTIVRRSGACQRITTQAVYANDNCEILLGSEQKVNHKPAWGDRGELIGCYAIAWVDGDPIIEWVDAATIQSIRDRSPGKNSPAWQNWFPEMGRKIVAKRLCKYLPRERIGDDLNDMDDKVIDGVSAQIQPDQMLLEHSSEQAMPMDIGAGHVDAEPEHVDAQVQAERSAKATKASPAPTSTDGDMFSE